nr:YceI family protein [uncultured Capnocytophaga sp.]
MKKIVLSLAVVASVALSSCNNTNTQQSTETATPTTEETVATETPSSAPAYAYVVAPQSVVEWVGTKPAGKHNGTVEVKGGVNVENGAITKADFVLDMNTITVLDLAAGKGKEDLEAHLKGTDPEKEDHFFNVKEYPTANFVFKSFDGKNLTGDLTIKGKTKEVSFPATVTITDNEVSITSQSFKINRVDFGVNYGSKSVFDNLKDKFINDDIELVVKVKATK